MMKAIVKPEKTMAVDLKPGDVFVMELPSPQFFTSEMEEEIAIPVFLRTNIDASDATDANNIVYRLNITVVNEGHPLDMRVDPFIPPGMKS
jgi:hypothetical protein